MGGPLLVEDERERGAVARGRSGGGGAASEVDTITVTEFRGKEMSGPRYTRDIIDIPRIRGWVEAEGFAGYSEVEIFSTGNWWRKPHEEVLDTCIARHKTAV